MVLWVTLIYSQKNVINVDYFFLLPLINAPTINWYIIYFILLFSGRVAQISGETELFTASTLTKKCRLEQHWDGEQNEKNKVYTQKGCWIDKKIKVKFACW